MAPPLVEACQDAFVNSLKEWHSNVDLLQELWLITRELEIEELQDLASRKYEAARRAGSISNTANRLFL
jgi:hypothetical protein